MVSIVLDTNVLFSKEQDFTKALFGERLTEIIDEIESNDLYETVKVLIPQIVLDELLIQQIESYEETFNKIKHAKFHNFNIEYDNDYESKTRELFLKKLEDIRHSLVKVAILPYPKNESLESIIKRAVQKKAPFEGKTKESDKGFKDVILWETLLEYKMEQATNTVILFSGDGRMCDSSLSEEYNSKFNDTVYLIKKDSNLKNKDLFDCIEDLTKRKIKPLFSQQLELRLLNLINEENIGYLFINDKLEFGTQVFRCMSMKIISKEITYARDKIENYRISFTINIVVNCVLKNESPVDNNSKDGLLEETLTSELEVDYSFNTDTFYLREYDTVSKGRCVLRIDNVELDQNTESDE
jgi:PIN domain